MLRYALLALFVSSPSFAFYTAELPLQISRDNVHYVAPTTVTNSVTLLVRYDGYGTCFVAGAHADYPCSLNGNNDIINYPYLTMTSADFITMAASELVWTTQEFRDEYAQLLTFNPDAHIILLPLASKDKTTGFPILIDGTPPLKTRDGKTSYSATPAK